MTVPQFLHTYYNVSFKKSITQNKLQSTQFEDGNKKTNVCNIIINTDRGRNIHEDEGHEEYAKFKGTR